MSGIQFIVKKIDNAAATQGNIDGLVQFTSYEIKVLAYNDAGDGKYSNPVTVTTAEGGEYHDMLVEDVRKICHLLLFLIREILSTPLTPKSAKYQNSRKILNFIL